MVLPTDTTNDTDQFDVHPALHNDVNDRVNKHDAQVVPEYGGTGLQLRSLDAAGAMVADTDSLRQRTAAGVDIGGIAKQGDVFNVEATGLTTEIANTVGVWTSLYGVQGGITHPSEPSWWYVQAMARVQFLTDPVTHANRGGGDPRLTAWIDPVGGSIVQLPLVGEDELDDWATDRNVVRKLRAEGWLELPAGLSGNFQVVMAYATTNVVGAATHRMFTEYAIRAVELVF